MQRARASGLLKGHETAIGQRSRSKGIRVRLQRDTEVDGCWWLARGFSRLQTMTRAVADAGHFQPHLDCINKPAGANSAVPRGAPQSTENPRYVGETVEAREIISVRLSQPYLNGLYHRVGCWWLTRAGRGEVRSLQRGDAERRYFRAHLDCMNKPPNGNATVPKEFANEPVVRREIDETHLSLHDFEQVEIGMSRSRVVEILGAGRVRSQSEALGRTSATYEWSHDDWYILISLSDGIVVSKHQRGLK